MKPVTVKCVQLSYDHKDIVLPLPEDLYVRLEQTARATKQSLTDILVRRARR